MPLPAYQRPLRPVSGIANATCVLLGLASLAAVVAAIMRFSRAGYADNYRQHLADRNAIAEANAIDGRVAVFALIFVVLLLATVVVFIIWHYQLATNAQVLGGTMNLGPSWAIAGWFIPLANFVLPALQLRASARASGTRPLPLLFFWAAGYSVAFITYVAGIVQSPITAPLPTVTSVESYFAKIAQADRTAAIGLIITVVAGVLAILTVTTLTRSQRDAALARTEHHPLPPVS